MGTDYLSCFALCILTGALAWLARILQGSWLSPGAVTAGVWCGAGGAPLLLAPDDPMHISGYGFAFCFAMVGVAGSSVGSMVRAGRSRKLAISSRRSVGAYYYALLAIGFVSPALLFLQAREFAGMVPLLEMAMEISRARYASEFAASLLARLPRVAIFAAAAIGGYVLALTPPGSRSLWRSALWIVPVVGAAIIDTARAAILHGVIFWVSGAVAGLRMAGRDGQVRIRRLAWQAGATLGGVAALGIVLQGMRMGRTSIDEIPFLADYLRLWVVGHMPVLGYWLDTEFPSIMQHTWGTQTFAGIAEWIGVEERESGLYESPGYAGGGNVFTVARPLLADFGLAGSAVFFFGFALWSGVAWNALRRGHDTAAVVVIGYLAFVLWSPITSIFAYNTPIAALGVFFLWILVDARARRACRAGHGARESRERAFAGAV